MDNNFLSENISDRLEFYRVQGFDHMQLDEIEKGLTSGVNVEIYADKKYMFLQMAEIRKGLEQKLDVVPYLDEEYDWFQMREIRRGIHDNVDVSIYLDKHLDYLIMREIRKGLLDGIDLRPYYEKGYYKSILREIRHAFIDNVNIDEYVEAGYSSEQLEQIRLGLDSGVDISKYLNEILSGSQMYEIRSGLEEGLDINLYNDTKYNWLQMREIRLGLKAGVDVSSYISEYFSHKQMREIRLGLEDGLDVSEYASFMWSATDMQNRRIMLKEHGVVQSDLLNNSVEILSFHESEVDKTPQISRTSEEEKPDEEQSLSYANISVDIDDDGMSAYLIGFLNDDEVKFKENEIMNTLKQNGIRQGIKKDVVDSLVTGMKISGSRLLIAEAKKPIDGEDGYFEYFFNTDIDFKPKVNEDGSVNYDDVKLFEQVEEGETIAIYHPATNGIYGYDVRGKLIHPKKGVNQSRLKGKGFTILDDGVTYVADFTGCIEQKNDYIEISNIYKVKGDVTAGHGNIKFDGDVYIIGDVGSRVSIEATGSVTINGNVDAAFIKAGKDVLIKSGVSAKGIGSIEAGNDVHGKYFENVRIYAENNIESNYLYNCNAIAMNKVIISGRKGSIVGGVTSAIYGIEASSIGNQSEIKTNFEIGANSYFENKLRNWHIKSEEVNHKIIIFREELKKLQMQRKLDVFKQSPVYQNVQTAILQLLKEMEEIKAERDAFTAEIAEKSAMISLTVSRTAYAGCLIVINKARLLLDHEMKDVTFKEVNEKIVPIMYH
ncbi:MAG: DUF342 domain-containing protein [Lachnospiraceae bacterium]|nr:DUF342 domain-containing protein [Lachnospiraceae bacterium]